MTQQVLRVVELAAGEPARVHDVVGMRQYLRSTLLEANLAEVANGLPEIR